MSIAETLKKKRNELHISQEAAAEKAGIARRTLAYYESGERVPNAENLVNLCKVYGLNINSLIETNVEEEKKAEAAREENLNAALVKKIDDYLIFQEEKKNAFRKGARRAAAVISIILVLILAGISAGKIFISSNEMVSLSEAAAKLWSSIFQSLKDFIEDPNVIKLPLLS